MNVPTTLTPTAAEQALALLRSRIVTGVLTPGQIINDSDIAAEIGCSRTPVREAIKMLEQLGCIESVKGRLTRVANVNLADLHQLAPPIIALTRLIAPSVATNATNADIETLEATNVRIRDAAAQRDWPAALQANWEFHEHLATIGDNTYLAAALMGLMFHSERIGAVLFYASPDTVPDLADDHDHIVAAIRNCNIEELTLHLERHCQVDRFTSRN